MKSVPWRSRESSYSGGGGTKLATPRSASVTERTAPSTTSTSTLSRKERDSYAGLSNYRPPPTTSVRAPLSSSVRERVSQADVKYGGSTGGGGSGSGSSSYGKYTRSYSSERTPSSELVTSPTKTLDITSPVKEKPSLGSFRTSRYGAAYTPPETPTLRLGSSARFGGQIARSPLTDKSPTVFGVSGPLSPSRSTVEHYQQQHEDQQQKKEDKNITLVTRSTSPTPPCNSSFLRARRADMEATIVVEVPRAHFRPICVDSEAQADEKESAKETSSCACVSPSISTPSKLSSWASSRLSSLSTVSAAPRYTPRLPTYSSYSRPTDLPLRTSPYKTESETKQLSEPRVHDDSKSKSKPEIKEPNKTDEATPRIRPEPEAHQIKPKSPVLPVETKPKQVVPDEAPRNEKTKTTPTENKETVKKTPSGTKLKKSKSTKTLPPPAPKTEPSKNIVINKDFRKSALNMDLSSSGDSLDTRNKGEVGAEKSNSKSSVNKALKKSSSKLKVSTTPPKLTLDSPKTLKGTQSSKPMPLSDSDSSSEGESSSESSESSEESSDDEKRKNPNLLSVTSKTSAPLSSAEESSVSAEKPPKPPLSPRSARKADNHKSDEPKAVVVRTTIAPVSKVMKVKYPTTSSSAEDISEKSSRSKISAPEKSKGSSSEGTDEQSFNHYVLRKFDSGDRAWWMESNKDIPSLNKSASKVSIKEIEPTPKKDATNKSLSSDEPIPEEVFVQSNNFTPGLNRIHQKILQERAYPLTTMYKIRKMDSGERAWWMESTNDVPGLQKSEKTNEIPKPDAGTKKTESSSSLAGLKKNKSSKSLSNLQKNDSAKSVPGIKKSDSLLQVPGPGPGQAKENKASGLKKTSSMKSLPSLQKVPSSKSIGELQRNASSKSLQGLMKSESKKSLKESGVSSGREGDSSSSELTTSSRTRDYPRVGYRICRMESGDREWWLNEEEKTSKKKIKKKDGQIFVGNFVNIDHILGNLPPPPSAIRTPRESASEDSDSGDESCKIIAAENVKIHDSTAKNTVISPQRGMIKLDDTALQLYKDGDYGAYLDLEASIDEQQEEFDSFNTNRKNAIVLRTQLSVRVHTIIEKLLNSEGRDLRRALFSLKQIFQEDKDLVHEFVQNDGLACLIRVGTDADQNYQNYILRALGQIMLYVDGMNGVIDHPPTVQWLYSLVASKFRLVVKTALKLLLVFVEYVETNCFLLVKAIRAVDYVHSTRPWSNIMKLMKEYDAADTELLIYAMSLINKTLNGLPDQDMYYDQVDALEEQGLEAVIRRYMAKQGTDLDLLRQFQIYEAVLQHEDGEEKGTPLRQLDETIRKALRNRKSLTATLNPVERRKSRRNSTGNTPLTITLTPTRHTTQEQLSPTENVVNGEGVTPGIRRRKERAERQRSFIREQREATLRAQLSSSDQSTTSDDGLPNGNCAVISNGHSLQNGIENHDSGSQHCREGSVKDLTQKLATTLNSPADESKLLGGPFGDMKGIISKAKEGLAKSQSRGEVLKSPTGEMPPRVPEVKKTETDLHWEELLSTSTRELCLCDLDFRDLGSDDERDILAPTNNVNGIPPPPPPCGGPPPPMIGPPPPIIGPPPAPILAIHPIPPPSLPFTQQNNKNAALNSTPPAKKTKKTVKLFWKEVRDDPIVVTKMNSVRLLWDELSPVQIDTQKLEHLFESRAKDLITKEKQQEMNKNKEIIVLDPKRSNAINIGMTKLPPPRSIKTAILKMDATVMNREGIEKLLTMLPSEEERSKIQEAQAANPDLPLGSAEQFLLTLASISELDARLKLWAFKLDYENSEKEIAEPLMDLKQGMETLKINRSFRAILGTLLSIGIFLNGTEVKGFQIEYLSKVPEVKDTVHKHSLLHHLCYMVMEKFPDSTDLYSEIGAVTRASKVDFEELAGNIQKMEQECKASFDHLKIISKHDGTTNMKMKMSDFLADCAERIIVLGKVHRRILNRYHKFCLWLGIPLHRVSTIKPNELCRIISEFALEYRTTRERVLQQLEKKASHRERNKTRGKMITEVGKFRSQEDRADAELKELLGNEKLDKPANNTIHGSLPWRRTRKEPVHSPVDGTNGNLTDADDEIIESLVKTATKTPVSRTTPRERKRTRNADRKSLIKRSRTRENVPCEGRH